MNPELLTAVTRNRSPRSHSHCLPASRLTELVGLIEYKRPPQSDGRSVAAMCVVPSLPTAEAHAVTGEDCPDGTAAGAAVQTLIGL
jgi:hypothetical protein